MFELLNVSSVLYHTIQANQVSLCFEVVSDHHINVRIWNDGFKVFDKDIANQELVDLITKGVVPCKTYSVKENEHNQIPTIQLNGISKLGLLLVDTRLKDKLELKFTKIEGGDAFKFNITNQDTGYVYFTNDITHQRLLDLLCFHPNIDIPSINTPKTTKLGILTAKQAKEIYIDGITIDEQKEFYSIMDQIQDNAFSQNHISVFSISDRVKAKLEHLGYSVSIGNFDDRHTHFIISF